MMQKEGGIWLNKFMSESGLCSRREADKLIEQGLVFINRRKAQRGDQVMPGDVVRANGQELEPREKEDIVFIALNKPVGIVSTTEKNTRDNIINYVNHSRRIFPIGRLDKDSQGLIFLTNDGDLVNRVLRAGNKHEKEYVVTVNKPLTEEMLQGMAAGVPILGVNTKKCKIFKEGPKVFRITLIQGLNRQIRRMCEHFNYEVVKLERVRIMHITLKGLPLGDWRELTDAEMEELLRVSKKSSSDVKRTTKKSRPANSNRKPTDRKASPGKSDDTRSSTSKPSDRKVSTARSSTAKPSDRKVSTVRSSTAKPSDRKVGATRSSSAKPSDRKPRASRSTGGKSGSGGSTSSRSTAETRSHTSKPASKSRFAKPGGASRSGKPASSGGGGNRKSGRKK